MRIHARRGPLAHWPTPSHGAPSRGAASNLGGLPRSHGSSPASNRPDPTPPTRPGRQPCSWPPRGNRTRWGRTRGASRENEPKPHDKESRAPQVPRVPPGPPGTHGAAEGQEELEDPVLGEGRVPGHQVDKALQRPPPGLDELPVGWGQDTGDRRPGHGPPGWRSGPSASRTDGPPAPATDLGLREKAGTPDPTPCPQGHTWARLAARKTRARRLQPAASASSV